MLLGLVLRTSAVFISLTLTILTYNFSTQAGLNQGISSTLFATSCVFTSISFYCIFNQRLGICHIFGIVLMLLCVTLIGLSKSQYFQSENIKEDNEQTLMIVICLSLSTAMFCSSISFITKFWLINYQYDSLSFGIHQMFLFGLLLLPACLHYHFTEGYTQNELIFGTIGSAIS